MYIIDVHLKCGTGSIERSTVPCRDALEKKHCKFKNHLQRNKAKMLQAQ